MGHVSAKAERKSLSQLGVLCDDGRKKRRERRAGALVTREQRGGIRLAEVGKPSFNRNLQFPKAGSIRQLPSPRENDGESRHENDRES